MFNNLGLTRREKTALTIAAFFAVIFIFIPQHILDGWELLYLFLVVLPLGIYVISDPERIHKENK